MSNPIIKEVNASTGEEVEREMTNEELIQWEAVKAEKIAAEEEVTQKAIARAEILSRLGLTDEEVVLLLG